VPLFFFYNKPSFANDKKQKEEKPSLRVWMLAHEHIERMLFFLFSYARCCANHIKWKIEEKMEMIWQKNDEKTLSIVDDSKN